MGAPRPQEKSNPQNDDLCLMVLIFVPSLMLLIFVLCLMVLILFCKITKFRWILPPMEDSLRLRADRVACGAPPIKLQHLQRPEHDRQVGKLLDVARFLVRQNEGLADTSLMVLILVPSLTVLIFVLSLVVLIFGLSLMMFSVVLSLMVLIFVLSLRVLFWNSGFASRASGSAWGLMGAEEILLRLHRSSLNHGCPLVRHPAHSREAQVLANLVEHLRHLHAMSQRAHLVHVMLSRRPSHTRFLIFVKKPKSLLLRLMSRLPMFQFQNPFWVLLRIVDEALCHGCGWAPTNAGDSNCGRMMHTKIKYDAHRLRAHDAHTNCRRRMHTLRCNMNGKGDRLHLPRMPTRMIRFRSWTSFQNTLDTILHQ